MLTAARFWAFTTASVQTPQAAVDTDVTMLNLNAAIAENAPVTVYFTDSVFASANGAGVAVSAFGGTAADARVLPFGASRWSHTVPLPIILQQVLDAPILLPV